jgi:hypothetical protein
MYTKKGSKKFRDIWRASDFPVTIQQMQLLRALAFLTMIAPAAVAAELQATARIARTRYREREPITLTFILKNVSKKPILIKEPLCWNPGDSRTNVSIEIEFHRSN